MRFDTPDCYDTDNVFSSLAGLQFMWQLSPLSQTGDVAHRLLHVPLKQTSLIDGEIENQIELEQNVSIYFSLSEGLTLPTSIFLDYTYVNFKASPLLLCFQIGN